MSMSHTAAAAVVFSTPDQLHYGIAVLIVRDLNSVAAFRTLNQGFSGNHDNHQPHVHVPWLHCYVNKATIMGG